MSFLWPPNGSFAYAVSSGSVNIFDTLEIQYTSTWSALNFTLFCQIGDVSTDYGVWQAPGNPMSPTGIYRLASIYTAGFDIVKFPTECAFRMTEYGDANTYNAGQFFQVISDPGVSTTYLPTSTSTTGAASQSSSTSEGTASSTNPSSTQTTNSVGVDSTPIVSSSSSTITSVSSTNNATAIPSSSSTTTIPVSQQATLSTGAKVGIAIGFILTAALVAGLCFLLFGLRRRITAKRRSATHGSIHLRKESPGYINLEHHKTKNMYTGMQELELNGPVELPDYRRGTQIRELE